LLVNEVLGIVHVHIDPSLATFPVRKFCGRRCMKYTTPLLSLDLDVLQIDWNAAAFTEDASFSASPSDGFQIR
jgi:hypothetical protein